MEFQEFKSEILKRAKEASACTEQYSRAYKSENSSELVEVIKDNFYWACNNKVIDGDLIDRYESFFNENEVWHNKNVTKGYLFASGSATVRASGSATVRAYDSATVEAYDSATVEAYGSATVRASGSATVRASGSATVRAYDSATVEAYDSATVEAYDSATVRAYGSATVEAYDSAYINCNSTIECKISDKSIVRRWDTNTIQFCSDELKFEKVQSE